MAKNNRISQDDVANESIFFCVKVIAIIVGFLTNTMSKTMAIRIVSMMLIGLRYSNNKIAKLVGCSVRTVRDLRKKMHNMSFGQFCDFLKIKKGGGRPCSVGEDIQRQIVEEVDKNPYSSLKQIAAMVKKKFKIDISTKILGRILKKLQSIKRKVRSLPGKANPEAQRSFYNERLAPALDKAKNGSAQVLFMDGSHFILSFRLIGYLYGTFRKLVKTFTGHKRFNVLGAINFVSYDLITYTSDKNLTHTDIIEFLKQIALFYYDKAIYVVLDRARYQDCHAVRLAARLMGINLIFLPACSPNLNLIERVWKFVKEKLRMQYYDDFNLFKNAIIQILDDVNKIYKSDMKTLINENFEFYDDLEEISEGILKKKNTEKKKVA